MTRNRKPIRTRSASDGPGGSEPRVVTSGPCSVALHGRRTSERGAEATRAIRSLPLAALIDPALALGVRRARGGGYHKQNPERKRRAVRPALALGVRINSVRSLPLAALIAALMAIPAIAQPGSGYVLKKHTIDGGGHTLHEGGGYRLGGTIGQHDAGDHAGGGYVLTGGFWTPAAPPPGPNPGACCDRGPSGGCQDDRALDECVCGKCEWFQERTCAQIDCTREAIPTVSEWGLVILTLLLLTGAKIYFGRSKVAGP